MRFLPLVHRAGCAYSRCTRQCCRPSGHPKRQTEALTAMAGATATQGAHPPLQKHKVVFLGDQGVGKTSIIKHFIYGSFEGSYQVSTTKRQT